MCQKNNVVRFPVDEISEGMDQRVENALNEYNKGNHYAAVSLLQELAEHECTDSYVFLGNFYEAGDEDIRNYEKAKLYYTKAIESRRSVEAYLGLGRIYYYGLGVDKDYCAALDLYVRVAEGNGNPIADIMLGKMFQNGECVDVDYKIAKKYFLSAWKKGNIFGLTNLALLEKKIGNNLLSLILRLKAGYKAFWIALKDKNDVRLREP